MEKLGGQLPRGLTVTTPLPPQTLASGATKSTRPVNSAMRNGQTPACAAPRGASGAPRGKDWGSFFEVSSNINILYILNGGGNATGVGPSLAFDKLPGA